MEPGIYIGFGSNLDPEANIIAAARLLTRDVDVVAASTVYESPALGRPDLPGFYHGVLRVETAIEPWPLKFEVLRDVEEELGAAKTRDRDAPRTIDLDILLYDDQVVQTPGLTVPAPSVITKAFVAVPLLELAGDVPLPGIGTQLAGIATAVDRGSMRPLVAFTKRLKEEVQRGYRQG